MSARTFSHTQTNRVLSLFCPLSSRNFQSAIALAAIGITLCYGTPSSALALQQNAPQASAKRIPTLATVNGRSISRQQLATETMRRFGTDVLESIVNKLLVMNELQQQGIQITEGDINNAIVEKAEKFGMSADRYMKLIQTRRNVSSDRYKNDIVWNELALRRLAEAAIEVTPEELAKRMEYEFGAKVQVRQIALANLQKARLISDQLKSSPDSFEKIAKEYSIDTNSASMGGLLPPVRRNSGFPQFEKVAFGLQVGQISDVVKFEDTFLIMRCERIFEAEELTPEQTASVHERLLEEIGRDKLRDSAVELFKELQESAQIVNVMNDPKLAKQMPGVAAVVNGSKVLKNQVAEECITRFGKMMLDVEITRSLLVQALEGSGTAVDQEDLNREIDRAATASGFADSKGKVAVAQYLASVTSNDASKIDFYIEDQVWPTVALKALVEDKVNVSEEDMQKGFEANFGPGVEVLAIVLQDQRTATKVWKMAAANPTAEYFGQLAYQYSIEPASKNNHGQVPPIQRFSGKTELEKEAFSLSEGERSKVIQIGEHWAILYCKGFTNPKVSDFDAVKEELHANILEKKMRLAMGDEMQRIRADAQIDNYLTGTSQTGKAIVRSARAKNSDGRLPIGRR